MTCGKMSTTDYLAPKNLFNDLLPLLGGILSGESASDIFHKLLPPCLLSTNSDFTALILTPAGQPPQIITYDPYEFFENAEILQNEINTKIPAILRMLEIYPEPLETANIPPELRFDFIQELESVQYFIYPIVGTSGILGLLINAKLKGLFSASDKTFVSDFVSLVSFIMSFRKKYEASKAAEAKESLNKR